MLLGAGKNTVLFCGSVMDVAQMFPLHFSLKTTAVCGAAKSLRQCDTAFSLKWSSRSGGSNIKTSLLSFPLGLFYYRLFIPVLSHFQKTSQSYRLHMYTQEIILQIPRTCLAIPHMFYIMLVCNP